jgi:hypothetical protein
MVRHTAAFVLGIILWAHVVGGGPSQRHNFKPREGYVPDATTAIRVAEAVLSPIYGQAQIESERPFSATLTGRTWKVQGHLPEEMFGGVAEVWIDKLDCRILRVTHGK